MPWNMFYYYYYYFNLTLPKNLTLFVLISDDCTVFKNAIHASKAIQKPVNKKK